MLFAMVDSTYRAQCLYALKDSVEHSVLVDKQTGTVWYVPGGRSTIGCMLSDARCSYPFANDRHSGSLALAFETVLERAGDADVWLLRYDADQPLTMSQLLSPPPANTEYELLTVRDDDGQLLCTIAVCRDISAIADSDGQHRENIRRVEAVRQELQQCTDDVNRILGNCLVRMVSYSPDSHLLTLRNNTDHVLYSLTQTRCMTLVDTRSSKTAMHALNAMDDRTASSIDASVRTTLRVKGGMQLELRFCLEPVADKNGHILDYRGVLIDISDFLALEQFKGYTDLEFCEWLIREIGVAAVPGSSFFREPVNNLIRLHFARGKEVLDEALGRLSRLNDLLK